MRTIELGVTCQDCMEGFEANLPRTLGRKPKGFKLECPHCGADVFVLARKEQWGWSVGNVGPSKEGSKGALMRAAAVLAGCTVQEIAADEQYH
jgi:hypothetical protein